MSVRALSVVSMMLLLVSAGCTRKKEIRTAQMGDKAEIGPFTYEAIETRWPMSLEGRSAKDRFLIVHISIFNSSGEDQNIPGFEVVDDSGNIYPESADGTGVQQWLGVVRKLPASQTEEGNIVFDVPPKHYNLKVADPNDNFMYIDIPLNLTTEEPESKKIDGITPVQK